MKKVEKFKSKLSKTTSSDTNRNKVTQYIASIQSRQEEVPLLEQYIDNAKSEPLHLKNNTIKELFMKIFHICTSNSIFNKAKSFENIPKACLFVKFVQAIHDVMCCNGLSKKIKKWYNENNGQIEKAFSFRFRGKESNLYMQKFPAIINIVYVNVVNTKAKKQLCQILFQSIKARELLSYCVRVGNFSEEDLNSMERVSRELFISCCLYGQRVSPSLWTMCNVAPHHAKQCLDQYGLGLGCNTMEGREQKHQIIKKYAENTLYQNKWPMIFRHEFVQLLLLRENGFDNERYAKQRISYIPKHDRDCCEICRSKLFFNEKTETCKYCDNPFFQEVVLAVKEKF